MKLFDLSKFSMFEVNNTCLLQHKDACLFQGNAVTCLACSEDKRWLVTGEKGENSCVIVWDTYSG